jgi:hypothetical protein
VGENREEMNTHDEVGETICYDQVDRAYCQDVDETVWGIVVKRDAAGRDSASANCASRSASLLWPRAWPRAV